MMLWAAASVATQTPGSSGDLSVFGNYGVLGAVTGLLIVAGWRLVLREQKRGDEAVQEVKRLNAYIAETVVPALVKASEITEEAHDWLRRERGSG